MSFKHDTLINQLARGTESSVASVNPNSILAKDIRERLADLGDRGKYIMTIWRELSLDQQSKSKIRAETRLLPTSNYIAHMDRVSFFQFSEPAPELDEYGLPDAFSSNLTFILSFFDKANISDRFGELCPSVTLLSTVGKDTLRKPTPNELNKPWPMEGKQILTCPDDIYYEAQPGLDEFNARAVIDEMHSNNHIYTRIPAINTLNCVMGLLETRIIDARHF